MNRRLLIPIGAGVAVLLIWFVALWGPQSSALSKAKKRKNDALQQGATLRDQLTRLQQARRDQPLKQSQLETLRVAVPDQPNLAQFILDANDAASRSGIDFLSITPTPPSTTGAAGTTGTTVAGGGGAAAVPIRIGMTVTGGYFQVLDFMNRLNALPRLVVIDGVTMAASGNSAQLQVTLQERIFTTSTQATSGAAAAGGAGAGGASASSTTSTSTAGATTTTRAGGG